MSSIDNMNLNEVEQQLSLLKERKKQLLEKGGSSETCYECAKTGNRKIVILGGKGQIGRLWAKLFAVSGYSVTVMETEDWPKAEQIFTDAAMVLVAVPIQLTVEVIKKLTRLPSDCVLADVTSIKDKPLEAMLKVHSGSVVGFHPMFGPDVKDFNGQTIVVCHGRNKENYQWLQNQLTLWQAKLYYTTAKEHDEIMSIVQVLRHFSTIAYGHHLSHENVSLKDLLAMCSPIYRLELAMVGRLFAQDPSLYTEIIFSNNEGRLMIERYIERLESLLILLKSNDKMAFKQSFLKTKDWFGDYAGKFLSESGEMLVATKKIKSKG